MSAGSVARWPLSGQNHWELPSNGRTWLEVLRAWVCTSVCLSVSTMHHPYLHLSHFPDTRKQKPTAIKGSLEPDHLGCSNPSSPVHSCLIVGMLLLS